MTIVVQDAHEGEAVLGEWQRNPSSETGAGRAAAEYQVRISFASTARPRHAHPPRCPQIAARRAARSDAARPEAGRRADSGRAARPAPSAAVREPAAAPAPCDAGCWNAALRDRRPAVPWLGRPRRTAHASPARDDAMGLRRRLSRADLRRASRRAGDRALDECARRGRADAAAPAPRRPHDPHGAHAFGAAGRHADRHAPARRSRGVGERRRAGGLVHARVRGARADLREGGLSLRQRPGSRHALVSRSRARADAAQRRRRTRGLLSSPRRERGPARTSGRRKRHFASHPGSYFHGARGPFHRLTPRARGRPRPKHSAGGVRRRHPRERNALAVRGGRAAALPVALPERLGLAVLCARLRAAPAVRDDRHGRGLARVTRRPRSGRPRARRARGRDRRLLARERARQDGNAGQQRADAVPQGGPAASRARPVA